MKGIVPFAFGALACTVTGACLGYDHVQGNYRDLLVGSGPLATTGIETLLGWHYGGPERNLDDANKPDRVTGMIVGGSVGAVFNTIGYAAGYILNLYS